MTFKDLQMRLAAGEVCPTESINGIPAPEFIQRNMRHFGSNLTIHDDWTKAGLLWIFDHNVRAQHEFNPVKPSKGGSREVV